MEKETEKLFLLLKELQTKENVIQLVSFTHQELKNNLLKMGVKFYDEETIHRQDVEFEQYFSNLEIKRLIMTYEEVNYIRNGLNGSLPDKISERERFEPIQNKIKELKY